MRWLITSDWQTKFATLDASKRAHEQELQLINKLGIEGHIDLGDLKDDFNPVDVNVVQFQQDRKDAIHQAVVHDITLLGNHDMLGQYTADKNWFSLFDSISGNNIKNPGVLELGNCVFSCLPFRRSNAELLRSAETLANLTNSKTRNDSRRKILLFHCDVRKAKYTNANNRESNAKITLKGLHTKIYDRCFGGHIHLRQNLSDNTMYVGNPFATDNGEIDQIKGFIVYDDVKNTTKFIPSVVPGIFSWGYVKKHKPALVDGTRIKATVDCSAKENYHTALDKVATSIEHKYPNCIAYVVPAFRSVENREVFEVDPTSSDYDKIKTYVNATIPEHLHKRKKALVQYLATILGNATSSGIRQSGKIIFDSISADNVLSLNKTKFSFRNKGIVLVKGVNKDWQGHSNGSGKTNFLSLIPISLFGRTFKGQQSDAWANDKNKEKAICRLNMLDDKNRNLCVVRGRRPVRLKFLINGSDESTGRRHTGKKETQGLIEETTGYTFDTLANSVYIDQSLTNAFLGGTEKTRAALIHAFQNMDRFKLAQKLISKEVSLLNKQEIDTHSTKEVASELLSQLEQDIVQARKRRTDNLNELKLRLVNAKTDLSTLRVSRKQIQAIHKKQHDKLEKELLSTLAKIDLPKKAIVILENAIQDKEAELRDFSEISDGNKCPACSQPLTKEHKQIMLARFKKAISAKRTELKKQNVILRQLFKEREALELPLANRKKELNDVDSLVHTAEDTLDRARERYTEAKEKAQGEKSDIGTLLKRKQALIKTINRASRVSKHIADEHTFLSYAQTSMSRDGLPSFLNKMLCPLLNRAASRYSEIFIDKEIQVLFDVEDGHIVPSIVNTHGGKTIASQSTGEKAWAAIITSFALREIAQPTNLLVLDEPGTGLDESSATIFGRRLRKLTSMIETILVVSHNPAIISALDSDNSVTVVKHNQMSTVKYNKN